MAEAHQEGPAFQTKDILLPGPAARNTSLPGALLHELNRDLGETKLSLGTRRCLPAGLAVIVVRSPGGGRARIMLCTGEAPL